MKTKAELITLLPERLRKFEQGDPPTADDETNLAYFYGVAAQAEMTEAGLLVEYRGNFKTTCVMCGKPITVENGMAFCNHYPPDATVLVETS